MLEINNTTRREIDGQKLAALAAKFLRAYRRPGATISLALVGPARMRQLNKRYRKIDKATDVLSFGGEAGSGSRGKPSSRYLGEIVINVAAAAQVSKYRDMLAELGLSISRGRLQGGPLRISGRDYIMYFLFIHGLLHLVGYDDTKDAERLAMLRRGKKFLDQAKNAII